MTRALYQQIVGVTQDYLGPAADRFVARQIESHLSKQPHEVTQEDVPRLVEWVRVSLAMLTKDKSMVEECASKINNLKE